MHWDSKTLLSSCLERFSHVCWGQSPEETKTLESKLEESFVPLAALRVDWLESTRTLLTLLGKLELLLGTCFYRRRPLVSFGKEREASDVRLRTWRVSRTVAFEAETKATCEPLETSLDARL